MTMSLMPNNLYLKVPRLGKIILDLILVIFESNGNKLISEITKL